MLPSFNPNHSNQPLQLSEEEVERQVFNIEPRQSDSFRRRVMRGMNCCVFILKQLGFEPPKEMDHTYNEDFIEVKEITNQDRAISAKLVEPHLVCNVDSVYTFLEGELIRTTRREFLSKYINSPIVLMFMRPIKDGSPTILPIYHTVTVEADVVRGFFSCLYNMKFDLIRKNTLLQSAQRMQAVRQVIVGGASIVDDIEPHLLPQSSS